MRRFLFILTLLTLTIRFDAAAQDDVEIPFGAVAWSDAEPRFDARAWSDAETRFNARFGYVSRINKKTNGDISVRPKAHSGFYAGIDYEFSTSVAGLSVRPAALYSYTGGKSAFSYDLADRFGVESSQVRDRHHSLTVPVDAKYTIPIDPDFSFYAFAGPRFDIGLFHTAAITQDGIKRSYDMFSGKLDGFDQSTELEGFDHDLTSRFDLQLGLGVGIRYTRVSFEMGFDQGLLNSIRKGFAEQDERFRRSRFTFGLGYAF